MQIQISDQELLALLGEKQVEIYLAEKTNRELAKALEAAREELDRRPAAPSPNET